MRLYLTRHRAYQKLFASIKPYVFFTTTICLSLNAHALTTDRNQPVYVEADHVSIDDANEISTYTGNVHYRQGSIAIEASEVVIYTKKRQLDRVIAMGSPVKFKQRPDNQERDVFGHAQTARFEARDQLLVLTGSAELTQGDNKFASAVMEYDLKTNVVRASSDQKSNERVRVVIQPQALPFSRE